MSQEGAIKDRLRRWIADKSGAVPAAEIGDDRRLLEDRLLISVRVPELLRFIEELRGRPIAIESLAPGVFADISSIYRAFFADVHD